MSCHQGCRLDARSLGCLKVLTVRQDLKGHGFRVHQKKVGGTSKPWVYLSLQIFSRTAYRDNHPYAPFMGFPLDRPDSMVTNISPAYQRPFQIVPNQGVRVFGGSSRHHFNASLLKKSDGSLAHATRNHEANSLVRQPPR